MSSGLAATTHQRCVFWMMFLLSSSRSSVNESIEDIVRCARRMYVPIQFLLWRCSDTMKLKKRTLCAHSFVRWMLFLENPFICSIVYNEIYSAIFICQRKINRLDKEMRSTRCARPFFLCFSKCATHAHTRRIEIGRAEVIVLDLNKWK